MNDLGRKGTTIESATSARSTRLHYDPSHLRIRNVQFGDSASELQRGRCRDVNLASIQSVISVQDECL